MIFSLFSLVQSAVIVNRYDLEQTREAMKEGWCFILAASSLDYEYSDLIRSFTRGAHLSTVQAKFIVLDVSIDNPDPSEFNITHFPAQLFVDNGVVVNFQYRGFDDELTQSFINNNAVNSIPIITNKEDFKQYLSVTAIAIIIAKADVTPSNYPTIAQFYHDHFSEVQVAIVDPSLVEKGEGFYVYRYLDGTLSPTEDLSTYDIPHLAKTVLDNSIPQFMKFNSYVGSVMEETGQKFAIVMLAMEDFYLTTEQLETIRALRDYSGLNISYSDLENSQTLGMRYGLPDSLDSTMAIIDCSGNTTYKYMMQDSFNEESAKAFIDSVNAGKHPKYWRSESDGTKSKDHLQVITANSIPQLSKGDQALVVAVYYHSMETLEPFLNATQALQAKFPKEAVFGKFSIMLNDWPMEEIDFTDLPYILIYKKGKIVYQAPQIEETEKLVEKITEVLSHSDDL